MAQTLICLKCGREEYDLSRTECRVDDGALWFVQHVAGQPGNSDVDLAQRLIRQGKKPWEKP